MKFYFLSSVSVFLKHFHFLNQKISFDRNFLPDQIYRFFPIRLNSLGSCSGKFQVDCFYIRRNVTIAFTSFLQYYFLFLKFFLSFLWRHYYYYLENHTFLSVYKDITKSSLTLRSGWGRKDILSTGRSFAQVICIQTLFNMCHVDTNRYKQLRTHPVGYIYSYFETYVHIYAQIKSFLKFWD